jgi:hypothetical protein
MANLMEFKMDEIKSLHLNVENVYRVGLDGSGDTDTGVIFYYNVASPTAATTVWGTTVTLASAITQAQADRLDALVRKVNSTPGGVVKAEEVLAKNYLANSATGAPFSVASESQPS